MNQSKERLRIGISPWLGYEFLYLASQKGFFKDAGLNVEFLELAPLADVKRVFEQGRIDGMTSTIIEAVEVAVNTDQLLSLIMVTNYSNHDVADLKGKHVGVDLGLLGTYILSLALEKNELSLNDVFMINVEQLEAKKQLMSGLIDAVITYPPVSGDLLKEPMLNKIFSSEEMPEDIIDVVVIREYLLTDSDDWQENFLEVWQRALDYAKSNPDDTYKIMAEREGVSVDEFVDELDGVTPLGKNQQYRILN